MQQQDEAEKLSVISRRQFACGLAAFAGLSIIPQPLLASIPKSTAGIIKKPARFLAFDNLHTGETTKLTYWEKGRYIKGALAEINYILRDHRTNEVARIDKELLDQLFVLHKKLGSRAPFQVISGYRSPKSNAKMHEHSKGVAKKSMHVEGKAIDIRLQDKDLIYIRNAALSLNAGGVGYYPQSQFVHVDTGRVRHW